VELHDGSRRQYRIHNRLEEIDRFVAFLHAQESPVRIAFEPTGNYHRVLAYRLVREAFEIRLVSSVASARYREAMFNSWDKNDPKDAAVILALLKQGLTQYYHDPLITGVHDLQEISKTHHVIVLSRTRIQHSLLTHYLPLYFPEMDRYWHSTRAEWFIRFLLRFPVPESVCSLDLESFISIAWDLVGRKVNKRAVLEEMYELAHRSAALPIMENAPAVETFRIQLRRYLDLSAERGRLESLAGTLLDGQPDYERLRTIPGIGPVLALTILAEAGDLRRFRHHRQFLKYCGLDLAKSQSGATRGQERLSKRGNARLRCAFWFAGRVAVRMRENSFRAKYERYLRTDPTSPDRKRKALTAVAAKMARVAYAVVKHDRPYRPYFEYDLPGGVIPFIPAVEAIGTS
jgi:transposase